MTTPMNDKLTALHDDYVAAVNYAVSHDDLTLAEELAEQYNRDAFALLQAA